MTEPTPNLDPKALAAGLATLRADTAEARELVITDRDTYAAVGAVLIERLKEYDASKALRDRVTKPLHEGWKNACALFKPNLEAWEELIKALKKAIGDYDLRELAEKNAAALAARAVFAAPAPDVAALTEALATANAPEAAAEGVGTRFVWQVKRYLETSSIDPEYLIPNEPKVNAVARAWKSQDPNEPPFVRGVVFELAAQVSGHRK